MNEELPPPEAPRVGIPNSGPTKTGSPREPRRVPGVWSMTLLLIVLVFAPVVYRAVPREISKWYLAAALENREAGKSDQAYQNLQKAMDWDAEEGAYHLQRAEWRSDDREYETALADANRAIELVGENVSTLSVRAQIYQHLARHGAAIADWKRIDRLSVTSGRPPRAVALNGLAYARAVGKLELSEGVKNIEEALQLEPGEAALLDTRGYLRLLTDNAAGALTDLDSAVQQVEAEFAATTSASTDKVAAESAGATKRRRERQKLDVAVIRYHRALVYERLGKGDEARKDRARAKELLGREPDETLF